MTTPLSPSSKQIFEYASQLFGGEPGVASVGGGENDPLIFNVLKVDDSPTQGLASYCTLDMSEWSPTTDGNLKEGIRLELLGSCASETTDFPLMMYSVASNSIEHGLSLFPGSVHEDVVSIYELSQSMQHVLLIEPFLWDGLGTLELPDRQVAWLQVIPISESEKQYLLQTSYDDLTNVFEEQQIDIFDINRTSAI